MVHHKNVRFSMLDSVCVAKKQYIYLLTFSKLDNTYIYDFYDDSAGLQVVYHFEVSCKTT